MLPHADVLIAETESCPWSLFNCSATIADKVFVFMYQRLRAYLFVENLTDLSVARLDTDVRVHFHVSACGGKDIMVACTDDKDMLLLNLDGTVLRRVEVCRGEAPQLPDPRCYAFNNDTGIMLWAGGEDEPLQALNVHDGSQYTPTQTPKDWEECKPFRDGFVFLVVDFNPYPTHTALVYLGIPMALVRSIVVETADEFTCGMCVWSEPGVLFVLYAKSEDTTGRVGAYSLDSGVLLTSWHTTHAVQEGASMSIGNGLLHVLYSDAAKNARMATYNVEKIVR